MGLTKSKASGVSTGAVASHVELHVCFSSMGAVGGRRQSKHNIERLHFDREGGATRPGGGNWR